MASIEEQLKQLGSYKGEISDTTLSIEDQLNDSPSNIGTFMAGIGSGFFKIPEGVVSLGATLIDLGAGTDTATEVEEFFADINPFDEYAQETTAGKK